MAEKKLTARQARFVDEYLVDFNATQAAIRAGYAAKTANREGARLLTNAVIKDLLNKAKKDLSEKTSVTVQQVVEGLYREAVREGEGSTQSARVAAWAHLGKYLGMFTDKVEHSGKVDVPTVRVILHGR